MNELNLSGIKGTVDKVQRTLAAVNEAAADISKKQAQLDPELKPESLAARKADIRHQAVAGLRNQIDSALEAANAALANQHYFTRSEYLTPKHQRPQIPEQ